jgi:hypothetical protein
MDSEEFELLIEFNVWWVNELRVKATPVEKRDHGILGGLAEYVVGIQLVAISIIWGMLEFGILASNIRMGTHFKEKGHTSLTIFKHPDSVAGRTFGSFGISTRKVMTNCLCLMTRTTSRISPRQLSFKPLWCTLGRC